MSRYDSSLWMQDIDEVIKANSMVREFQGKSILVTGASGLIGAAVIDVLIRLNETKPASENFIRIYAAGRAEDRMRERFAHYFGKEYFCFVSYDANDPEPSFSEPFDYVICAAGNSSPDLFSKEPVETMLSNVLGVSVLLKKAKQNKSRLLYVSSSEIYGKAQFSEPILEEQTGTIALLNPRNAYAIGKQAGEATCAAFCAEYGTEAVIVRPGHVYGPTALQNDGHVVSLWLREAAKKKDLCMKSQGLQMRSYCHCLDCATAILTVLLKGDSCQAYNVSNASSNVMLCQMGKMIAERGGVSLVTEVASLEEKRRFNPMEYSVLNNEKLFGLGWNGIFDVQKGIAHTLRIYGENKDLA